MSVPPPVPQVDDPAPEDPSTAADGSASTQEFLAAVRSLVDRVGGRLIDAALRQDGDEPLRWRGAVVAAVRLPSSADGRPSITGGTVDGVVGGPAGSESDADAGGLAGILAGVERQFSAPLADLPRPDKQRAVRLLEEAGAFSYRKAVETVAGALGVSRFTVYNYLNRERS